MMGQRGDIDQVERLLMLLEIDCGVPDQELATVAMARPGEGDMFLVQVYPGVINRRKKGEHIGRTAPYVEHLHARGRLQDFADVSRDRPLGTEREHQRLVD